MNTLPLPNWYQPVMVKVPVERWKSILSRLGVVCLSCKEANVIRIKIHGGVVVPVNAAMEVWDPGYLIIVDNQIAESGPGNGPEGRFDETIDAQGMVVMPGLINAHAHSPSNLLKGSWSRLPLELWRQYLRSGWREYGDEAIYVCAQLGIAEMLKTGCTAVLDHVWTPLPSAFMGTLNTVQAMHDAGMRGTVALQISNRTYESTVPIATESLGEEARREVEAISRSENAVTLDSFPEFVQEVRHRTGLVGPMVGPSAPHRCTDDMLKECMSISEQLDTAVHIHVAETKGQYLQAKQLYGMSPVAHLGRIGLLNERLSMAHCIWLTRSDVNLLAKTGVTAIHNPASNCKLGSGTMRLDEMIAADVRLGLATDGACSNDNQNMFESMRLAGLIHNRPNMDYLEWPSPQRVLQMATVGSAQALGLGGKAGSLTAGHLADVVLLTMDSYHLTPLNNVYNQLVFCENGASVRDVMVDGKWVVRNGQLTQMDEMAMYRRAREMKADMVGRWQEQFRRTASLEQPLREMYLRVGQTPWDHEHGAEE